MTDVALPTTIAASNIIGGVDEMRVRLLNRKNLLDNPNPEDFQVTGVIGSIGSGWWTNFVTATKVTEPESVFGRSAIEVDDASAASASLGQDTELRNQIIGGGDLTDETIVVTLWVKAVDTDTDLVITAQSSPATGGAFALSTGTIALTKDDWTFVAWVATLGASNVDAGDTAVRLKIFPAGASSADQGTIRILRPRLHLQREALLGFPKWPLRDLAFVPWLGHRRPSRNGLGQLAAWKRAVIPQVTARHPIANKAQMDLISAASQHDAPLLVEPSIDSEISFLMLPSEDAWDYSYLNGRAVGYAGRLRFDGLDPILGIPDVTRYYESETGTGATFPDWKMRIDP